MADLKSVLGSSYILSEDRRHDILKKVASSRASDARSFYLLNIDEVMKQYKMWHLKFPRIKLHYAVKCNDHPAVLKTLALLGANFDCASQPEMKKVMSYGVKASRIIYAHPCKIASQLKFARNKGVKRMTFDSEQELHKVARLFPDAELLIRIRCDDTTAQCPLGIKFGVMPVDAMPLLSLARQLSLKVVGVAFHVGSGCSQPSIFQTAIHEARRVFDDASSVGHTPTVLDIGGGFLSGDYQHLAAAAGYINEALSLHFPEGEGVEVIAEPGRYMVASAFTLCTPIINYKDKSVSPYDLPEEMVDNDSPMEDNVRTRMYFIDDGVYGSFNCLLYDHQVVEPTLLNRPSRKARKLVSSIWGPTCDGIDQVTKAVVLPELEVGEWLQWDNMGAYTISAAGQFNGFSVPEVKVCINSTAANFLGDRLTSARNSPPVPRPLGVNRGGRGGVPAPINGLAYGDYLAAALDRVHVNVGNNSSDVSCYFSSDEQSSNYSASDIEN